MTDHPITMTDPEAALWTELDDLRSRLAKAEIERDEARSMMLEAIERQKRAEADCDAARAAAPAESEDADALREVRAALDLAGFSPADGETEGDAVARMADEIRTLRERGAPTTQRIEDIAAVIRDHAHAIYEDIRCGQIGRAQARLELAFGVFDGAR